MRLNTKGATKNGGNSARFKQEVDIPVVNMTFCQKKYKLTTEESEVTLCVGKTALYKDTCQGDSG